MPLFSIVRFFTTLLSLVILAAAGYLLWSWYQGDLYRDAAGYLHRHRDAWRLWTGAALLAWTFLGRSILPLILARPDARPSKPERGNGQTVASPTGASIYVESHGRPEAGPIILTHGWGMDSTFWYYARQDLGDRFRLILWDLPGLGKSRPADKRQISLDAFAAELAALVEGCGSQRPVLVGHSIGGMTIQTLLLKYPQLHRKIAGVVLLNTTFTNPLKTMICSGLMQALQKPVLEPAMKLVEALQPLVWLMNWQSYLSGSAHLASRIGFGRYVTRSQLDHSTLLSVRNPPGVEARGNLAMFHWDASDALRGSPVPALVIGGDMDIVTKLEANRAIADESELATLKVVEGVNHMGPMERADVYNPMIAAFALQCQAAASADLPSGPARLDDAEALRKGPSPAARPH